MPEYRTHKLLLPLCGNKSQHKSMERKIWMFLGQRPGQHIRISANAVLHIYINNPPYITDDDLCGHPEKLIINIKNR